MKTLILLAALATSTAALHADGLTASDGAAYDGFGGSVSQWGSIGLVGAYQAKIGSNDYQGAAYVYRNLDTATGTMTQSVKLTASDGAANDIFGRSVSQSGNIGLVGADSAAVGSNAKQGAVYVYRNLEAASGTVTQDVKLTASDGSADDRFGGAISQSGSIGLVGAYNATLGSNPSQGAAYVYRNLNTATGSVTENVKLAASDGATNAQFGNSVSQSGNIGLVGAAYARIGANNNQGAAYIYRNLDTATGTVTQNAKLTASDGAEADFLGSSVSQSGSIGLVGAVYAKIGANDYQGAAYVFRDLDTATGTVTQNVKLTASDGAGYSYFGVSVSQSGSTGLVGASIATIGSNFYQGAAYVFRNLDTATGSVTENVKLTASDGASNAQFGNSVSLSGDQFTIGALYANSAKGKAYSGSVSSLTTLDAGSTSRTISQISFVSQEDWIVGQTTDGNGVTLSAGDQANVSASGKGVFIGKSAGSDNNKLTIKGTMTANIVNIGSTDGNAGNTLQLDSTAIFGPVSLRLAAGNFLSIQGDFTNIDNLLTYLGSGTLQVWEGGLWAAINSGNASGLVSSSYSSGYTTIGTASAVPEPSTYALLALGGLAIFFVLRRKRQTT